MLISLRSILKVNHDFNNVLIALKLHVIETSPEHPFLYYMIV